MDVFFYAFKATYSFHRFGIGDSPIENLNCILDWIVQIGIKPDETELQGFMEIQNMNISNVPVRIYTPKNILSDAGKKSTGVVFLHGGGWTRGSVCKFVTSFHFWVLK